MNKKNRFYQLPSGSLAGMLSGWLIGLALVTIAGTAALAAIPPGTAADQLGESQYAILRETFADRKQVKPGEQFTLALRITPYETKEYRFHTYGAQVTGNADYIASVLQMDAADGVEWSEPVWPEGEKKTTTGGDMYVLYGQNVITISGKLAADAKPGARTFSAMMMVSACTEEMCLPPSQVKLEWQMEVVPASFAGQIAVLSTDELTAPVTIDTTIYTMPPQERAAEEIAEPETPAGGIDIGDIEPLSQASQPIWRILLWALLGGLILNIMPCVLPVVSIKVISLARQAQEEPRTVALHGVLFMAGIVTTFVALAAVVALIQAGGTELGWGFQFQNPGFLIVMLTIIFAFGLSLAGVFTIKPPRALTAEGERLAEKEGLGGSFFKGILATVLGTPCVGPFLGPALGYAFTRSTLEIFMIFLAVGIGMGLPYVLLVINPRFLRMGRRERGELSRKILASKGWLVDFERVMAFVLFATVVYLLYILEGVAGGKGVIWTLAFLTGVAFAAWLWGRLSTMGSRGILYGLFAVIVVIGGSGWFAYSHAQPSAAAGGSAQLNWEDFSIAALQQYTGEGKTVLVDFTADWCPNCKYNEATALNIASTKNLIDDLGVVTLKADWTNRSDEISKMLRQLGFASVPLTAVFPEDDPKHPILLDGVYTAQRLQEVLKEVTH